jgi:hypothetical protein
MQRMLYPSRRCFIPRGVKELIGMARYTRER